MDILQPSVQHVRLVQASRDKIPRQYCSVNLIFHYIYIFSMRGMLSGRQNSNSGRSIPHQRTISGKNNRGVQSLDQILEFTHLVVVEY